MITAPLRRTLSSVTCPPHTEHELCALNRGAAQNSGPCVQTFSIGPHLKLRFHECTFSVVPIVPEVTEPKHKIFFSFPLPTKLVLTLENVMHLLTDSDLCGTLLFFLCSAHIQSLLSAACPVLLDHTHVTQRLQVWFLITTRKPTRLLFYFCFTFYSSP